jgi:hypothetical protein
MPPSGQVVKFGLLDGSYVTEARQYDPPRYRSRLKADYQGLPIDW